MPIRGLTTVDEALAWLRERGVRRLATDSRQVTAGDAFIAWPGYAVDARRYVPQALEAGAVACLVEAEGVHAYGFDHPRIAAFRGLKAATGPLAAAWCGDPAAQMQVVATTGTNGKTSTAWWTAQALAALGTRCAVVGTLGIGAPARGVVPTGLTTPEPVTVAPGSSDTVTLAAMAAGSGVVTAEVHLETVDGRRLTPDTVITVETTNVGAVAWTLVIVSGIVLVVTTVVRIKKVRARQKGVSDG